MKKSNSENVSSSSRVAALSLLSSLGLLLIAVAVVIPILSGGFPESSLYKWLYSAGALICIVASIFNKPPKDMSVRDRRWVRIESWSSIFFCAATFFLWYPGSTPRDWLAFTLAGGVIRIIVFFRNARYFNKN